MPEANLTADATRATLLALHVHRPTPWGYRNEVHVDMGVPGRPRLIDVATAEYLLWRPRFRGPEPRREDILGLEPLETGATGIGVGLERLAMVTNDLPRIHDVDYLEPFYDELRVAGGARSGRRTTSPARACARSTGSRPTVDSTRRRRASARGTAGSA